MVTLLFRTVTCTSALLWKCFDINYCTNNALHQYDITIEAVHSVVITILHTIVSLNIMTHKKTAVG
ncbi:hypothetical protein CKX94_08140 [Staphylococcus argenteus]|nr:hypothetical protein CKX94_08140 [Staphylococcus argenteus]